MIITVKVVPGAKINQIQESITGELKVWLTEKAVDGKANKALITALAKFFKVSKSKVTIKKGLTKRLKEVEIIE